MFEVPELYPCAKVAWAKIWPKKFDFERDGYGSVDIAGIKSYMERYQHSSAMNGMKGMAIFAINSRIDRKSKNCTLFKHLVPTAYISQNYFQKMEVIL